MLTKLEGTEELSENFYKDLANIIKNQTEKN